jgi:alpha-L-rhamnosidase
VSWRLDGRSFTLDVTVPPNTDADIHLPDGSAPVTVGAGPHTFTRTAPEPEPVKTSQAAWTPP